MASRFQQPQQLIAALAIYPSYSSYQSIQIQQFPFVNTVLNMFITLMNPAYKVVQAVQQWHHFPAGDMCSQNPSHSP
jgi:hypothetical protein